MSQGGRRLDAAFAPPSCHPLPGTSPAGLLFPGAANATQTAQRHSVTYARSGARPLLTQRPGVRAGLRAGIMLGVSCVLNRVDSRWRRQGNAAQTDRTPRRVPCATSSFSSAREALAFSSRGDAQVSPAATPVLLNPTLSTVLGELNCVLVHRRSCSASSYKPILHFRPKCKCRALTFTFWVPTRD